MNGEEIKRQINDAYYNDDMCSRYDLVDAVEDIVDENAKLREWCSDFWRWADPPFALKSGTFDEYMTLVERAVELRIEVNK